MFNGFALATVIGLPAGTLIGEAFGWRATFALVAVLSAIGLGGLVWWCPPIAPTPRDRIGPMTPDRRVVTALAVALAMFGLALRDLPSALVSVFALGASTFVIVPLVQTWLMERVGPARVTLAPRRASARQTAAAQLCDAA